MKLFPVNEDVDRQIELLMVKIRHLRNGETSELINNSGARYRVNYGVSIVHLREMAEGVRVDNMLAKRLWHRGVRETMIIATMVADAENIELSELEEWGKMLNTIELSEQMGRNLLSHSAIAEDVLMGWLKSANPFQQYASAMAIGWRLRGRGKEGFERLGEIMPIFKNLTEDRKMHRAVGFALKMGGRFDKEYRELIEATIGKWLEKGTRNEKIVAGDVKYELDAFFRGPVD